MEFEPEENLEEYEDIYDYGEDNIEALQLMS